MLQSVWEGLVSIHTKFELSRCLVCPTIEINICSIPLIKSGYRHHHNDISTPSDRESCILACEIFISSILHKAPRDVKFGMYAN